MDWRLPENLRAFHDEVKGDNVSMKAKRVFYLLMIVGLLAGTWALPVAADEPAPSTGPAPAMIQSLSGSNVTFDNGSQGYDFCAAPGSTQTFCFYAESFTNDYEYVYDVFLKFPTDWTVVSVWDNGPTYCDSGSWGSLSWYPHDGPWEIDIYHPRYMSPTDHCYTYYCAEVVTGSVGDASWYWDGDGYGGPPHWPCSDDGYTPSGMTACDEMINPVASIPPCEPGIYLNPEHQSGGVEPGGSADFDLAVMNMSGGTAAVNFYYTPSGPGDCYGPPSSDPIPDGTVWPFLVTVEMDPGAGPGDVVDCEIYAYDVVSGYDDYAWIHAEPEFPGPPAYALDVYPGYQLVYWDDLEIPGTWTLKGSVPQFHPGGDFLGENYDFIYAVDYDTNQFVTISTADGTRTVIGTATPTGNWTGVTGTADGGTLYASSSVCGTESYLYTIDPATGASTLVGSMRPGSCMIDIAINAEGEMYGVDIVDDSLYSIDTATGAATYIGSTGASANYAQGMDFDFATGTLYWAAYTASGELRTLDTGTGMSTLIGGFPGGNEVDCLSIPTGGGQELTMHVGYIEGFFSLDYLGRPILRMFVLAEDENLVPLGNVAVDASMWVPDGGPFARTRFTKPSGWARFHWGSTASGTWTICVDNLTLAGYVYNPDDNWETCYDWYY